jgi:hypothetical protein
MVPLVIDDGGDGPGPSSGLGEVNHCGPLRLKHGVVAM